MSPKHEIARRALEDWLDAARSVQGDSLQNARAIQSVTDLYYYTIGHETMHTLFSTAAQAVAAMTGLLVMCAIFRREHMEKDGDENNVHSKGVLRVSTTAAVVLAAFAIGFDLYMIYSTPDDYISVFSFCTFVAVNVLPILSATYGVWYHLK